MRKKLLKMTSTAGKKSDLLLQTCTQKQKTKIVKHQIVPLSYNQMRRKKKTKRGGNKIAKDAVLFSTMESLQKKSEEAAE